MSTNEDPRAQLIVTFFAISRLSQSSPSAQSPNASDPQLLACDNAFSSLLGSCVSPAPLSLLSHRRRAPGVAQSVFAISIPFPDTTALRHDVSVTAFEASHNLEIVFDLVPSSLYVMTYRPIKLAVFDMDSTLINEEVIDELARSIGITAAVSAITARAMNGEIEFAESLRQRLALLKGVKANVWDDLRSSITVAAGARELIKTLHDHNVVTAVVSGGFAPMAEWLKGHLGLDHAFANHLLVSPATEVFPYNHLSGELDPEHPVVVPEYKRDILETLTSELGISLSDTMAVGDGSNDLLMLGAAGLGIAWRAKERVQKLAPQRLNGAMMTDLLFLLDLSSKLS
ncbi:MAG: hypothetical protein Q9214_005282 [Letrouitia sp. 1 TL-2023]